MTVRRSLLPLAVLALAAPALTSCQLLAGGSSLDDAFEVVPAEATGVGSLTVREREIADLVAAGHTNREIAARLYLSDKTVEAHLSRAFAKLGVRSRAAVAAAVASSVPSG